MKLRNRCTISLAAVTLALSSGVASARPWQCDGFSDLSMVLERNATDDDTEVVVFAKGQDEGLRRIIVRSPTGQRVADFTARGRDVIGAREFVIESPEPPDPQIVLYGFPEGSYRFFGITFSGTCLLGRADLSHTLAPESEILSPGIDEVVQIENIVVEWKQVEGAVRYLVELKNEEFENSVNVEVLAPAWKFIPPEEWLESDTEYTVEIGVETASGNKTFVEQAFFTAPATHGG